MIMPPKWLNPAHAFGSLFHDIAAGAKAISPVLVKIQATEGPVEQVTGLFDPGAVIIERLAYGVLGTVVGTVHDTQKAADADGLNIRYDAAVIADIRKLLADYPQIVAQVQAAFPKK